MAVFNFVCLCYCSTVVLEYFSDFRLVAMNGSELSLYFQHSGTSGRPQLDDAPASAMAILTFPLRIFHFSSASFISALLAMANTSQVCSGIDCHPRVAESWLMKFGPACSSTWKVDGDTVDSGFLYDFSIILILATFIRFRVTIFYCPRSSYFPSTVKYFSSRARLFYFHCSGYYLLNFLSAKFRSLLNHCLFL